MTGVQTCALPIYLGKEPPISWDYPALTEQGDTCELRVLNGPLMEMTAALQKEFALARIMDARRPKAGQELEPATANQPANPGAAWALPGGTAALGAMIILATE